MNKEEIYIEPPKTNYIVLTTHLDNLELARYIEKIPDTYFATFPYVEHYKQLQQELNQKNKIIEELKEYLEKIYFKDFIDDETYNLIENKMQDLEKGSEE